MNFAVMACIRDYEMPVSGWRYTLLIKHLLLMSLHQKFHGQCARRRRSKASGALVLHHAGHSCLSSYRDWGYIPDGVHVDEVVLVPVSWQRG